VNVSCPPHVVQEPATLGWSVGCGLLAKAPAFNVIVRSSVPRRRTAGGIAAMRVGDPVTALTPVAPLPPLGPLTPVAPLTFVVPLGPVAHATLAAPPTQAIAIAAPSTVSCFGCTGKLIMLITTRS
jgi:hypothetical protein